MLHRALLLVLVLPTLALAQPRPVLERIEPTSGPPGTTLTLVGRGFQHVQQVRVGDTALAVQERLPFRWTVVVPAGATSGPVILQTRHGEFVGPYFRVTASLPAPTVQGISPLAGPPGGEVAIVGTGFSSVLSENSVFLAGRLVVVRTAAPTELRVIVPQGAASGPFVVRVANAGEVTTPPFTVAASTAITELVPPVGPTGSQVTIRGAGFSGRQVQVFFGRARAQIERATDTEIVVRVPNRARTGPVTVDIRGAGRAVSPMPFEVRPIPRIVAMTPDAGPAGTLVTLQGRGFGGDVAVIGVDIGGRAQVVRNAGDRALQFEIAPGTPSGPLTLTVAGLAAEEHPMFSGTGTLRVDGFSPTSGPAGTVVTFRGAGFSPAPAANAVTLSGVPAQVVAASGTSLQVRVPSAPAGPFELRVGSSVVRTNQPFVVAQPPFVAGFEPRIAGVGERVTIRGANFGTNLRLVRVSLNGTPMPVVGLQNDQIVVEVPRGATRGRLVVEVSLQGGTASADELEIEARREVSALTPSSGFAGTEVTIRGQGFPARGIRVQFLGAPAVDARRLSPVEIRAIVPAGAASGDVTVLLPNGRTMPAGTFTVTAAPTGTAITQIDPACAYPGCVAILRGHGFSGNTRQVRVRFLGEPARVREVTPTSITIQIPNRAGNGRFEVSLPGNVSVESPAFLVTERPR
ncbi:MAG: IPT/TIG domain-containing protein [Sandaracinus sp.]|nr:IPT/TIG domain-containing protein [Sandaracinus sp.]MCB9635919.1 IPT/TIG domain-containing protein [Sandaracinus sp.]